MDQQPPKPETTIIAHHDDFSKSAQELKDIMEVSKQLLPQFEGKIDTILGMQNDIRNIFEEQQSTEKRTTILEEQHNQQQSLITATTSNLKKHEQATLANTTAMLKHTEDIQKVLTKLKQQSENNTRTIDLHNEQFKDIKDKLAQLKDIEDTPRVTVEPIIEQERNSRSEQELKNLKEKFDNLLNNKTDQDTTITNLNTDVKILWRSFQLCMAGSVAVLLASFWIWWHAHKA